MYEKKHPAFLGATLGSNNTAKLTALGQTVRFLLYGTNYRGPVTTHYDSVYAYKMATGQRRPRSNLQLIQTVQDLVSQVAGLRTVHWQHVYGHTGVTGDERADRNADRKSKGERCMWPRVRFHRRQEPGAQLSSAPTVPEVAPSPAAKMPRSEFSEILVDAVEATVGRTQPNKLASFYTDADKDEIQHLMMQQAQVWQKLKVSRGLPRETALRHELHSIKASIRRYKQAIVVIVGYWT